MNEATAAAPQTSGRPLLPSSLSLSATRAIVAW